MNDHRITTALVCLSVCVHGCAQRVPLESQVRYAGSAEAVANARVEVGGSATMPLTLIASGRTDDDGGVLMRVPVGRRLHLRVTVDSRSWVGTVDPDDVGAQWSEWDDLQAGFRVNPPTAVEVRFRRP